MILLGGIPHVDAQDLIRAGLDDSAIRQARKRNSWRFTDTGLVDLTSMPEATRRRVEAVLPILAAQMAEAQAATRTLALQRVVKLDMIDETQIGRHRIDGKALDSKLAADIALASAWLRTLATVKPRSLGFMGMPQMLETAATEIARLRLKCFKCASPAYLRQKVTAFKQMGWRCLVPAKLANTNARKLTEPMQEILRQLAADPRRFPVSEVCRQYQAVCMEQGWQPVADRTIYSYLLEEAVRAEVDATRNSKSEWNNGYSPVIKRDAAQYPDDLWVLDGTAFELYYKEGNTIKRLYWVWVLDAATWRVLGYATGDTETGELVRRALRMAVRTTGALPHQLQFDNGSAFKAAETLDWMKLLARTTPTAVGNARAKIAEPFWAHYQRHILKYYPNHSGGNVKAKRMDTHANTDAIKENWREFPDRSGVERQVAEATARWNSRRFNGSIPDQAYAAGSPRRRIVEGDMYTTLFWVERRDTVKYTNQGLRLRTNGVEEYYLAPAGGTATEIATFFADHTGESFRVKADPDDMAMVAMLDKQGRVVAYAAPTPRVPMALASMDEQGGKNLGKMRQVQQEVRRIVEERRDETASRTEEILKGAMTYQRVHKDSYNAAEATLKRREIMGELEPVRIDNPTQILGKKATYAIIERE